AWFIDRAEMFPRAVAPDQLLSPACLMRVCQDAIVGYREVGPPRRWRISYRPGDWKWLSHRLKTATIDALSEQRSFAKKQNTAHLARERSARPQPGPGGAAG